LLKPNDICSDQTTKLLLPDKENILPDKENKFMKKLLIVNVFLLLATPAVCQPVVTVTVNKSDTVCASTSFTFYASVTGGTPTSYEWLKNGLFVAGSPAVTDTFTCTGNIGDAFQCSVDGINTSGISFYNVNSNEIDIISALIVPTIAITGSTAVLPGTVVTLNATVANAGPTYNIQWRNKGVLFATTSVPTITYTKGVGADTITAKAVSTSTNGCYDSTISAKYVVRDPTGVNAIEGQSMNVNVYPNPAHNTLTITAPAKIDHITICNMPGQTMPVPAYTYQGDNEVQQSIEGLPAGMYLVQVQCGEDRYVGKVVIE